MEPGLSYMLSAPAIAAAVSTVSLAVLLRAPRFLEDKPNDRSLHQHPVPRAGGIAIVLAFLSATAWFVPNGLLLALAGAVAVVSLIDDWLQLPITLRLAAQLAAATAFAVYCADATGPVKAVTVVLAVVWSANLYNFMDGSDGLAAGMAVIGFGAYGFAAYAAGDAALAWMSASISAAVFPFLLVNFHPAKLFMGDVGSVTLGFLAGCLGILGWQEGTWPLVFPVLVFSPFVADATFTLLRRTVRRQAFWKAHREHYYQRLVRMGVGHRNTALIGYAFMLAASAAAFFGRTQQIEGQLALTLCWFAVLCIAGAAVDLKWQRHLREGHAA